MEKVIHIVNKSVVYMETNCIVNAANTSLLGGGGVDGAIHNAAGIGLFKECKSLNGCKTGESKITNGYNLNAKYVIHTVGPIWRGGNNNEDILLESCYITSLKLADSVKAKSISYPGISTGVYNYPLIDAACIALKTISSYLKNEDSTIMDVYICCFTRKDLDSYIEALKYYTGDIVVKSEF